MSISPILANAIQKYAVPLNIHKYSPDDNRIQDIMTDYWDQFLLRAKRAGIPVKQNQIDEVNKMIKCRTRALGFDLYECPECHKTHIFYHTCKGRFCPSCGVKSTKERSRYVSSFALDVNHRHIVFTIDYRLREYFSSHPEWLDFLFQAVYETILYAMNPALRNAIKKNPQLPEYRQKKLIKINPGLILTLHTFGRDLKWNPHIHGLLTEGGMNPNHVFKEFTYIDYEAMRKSFMKILLDKMRDALPFESLEQQQFVKLRGQLYRDNKNGFYVHAPHKEMSEDDNNSVTTYIMRYTGRPPMAQSRIIKVNHEKEEITYWYEDHRTNQKIVVTESVYIFIRKLIQHIPEKQFKMTRYYGLYATANHKHKHSVRKRQKLKQLITGNRYKRKLYRQSLIDTFHVDPLLCTCGAYLEYVESYIPPRYKADGESP